MAYEFKRLSDVNAIEEMKDGLNVLVEDDGEIVKLAADSMISNAIPVPETAQIGQTVVVKSVDENDKPTEWEAVTKQHVEIVVFEDNRVLGVETPLSSHDGNSIVMMFRDTTKTFPLVRREVWRMGHTEKSIRLQMLWYSLWSVTDGFKVRMHFGDEYPDIIANSVDNTITFDPDWVAPAELIPAPATAEVGQIVAVKAVDENGKPTEWGTANSTFDFNIIKQGSKLVLQKRTFAEITEASGTGKINTITPFLSITGMNSDATTLIIENIPACYFAVNKLLGSSEFTSIRANFMLSDGTVVKYQINPDDTVTEVIE